MDSVLRKASNYGLKAWVSGCETKGFRTRKHGFQDVKQRVSQMKGINFEK